MQSKEILDPLHLPQHFIMISHPIPSISLMISGRNALPQLPEIVCHPYSRSSLNPRRKKRILRLPVNIVAHHGEPLRRRRAFEVLCKSQGGSAASPMCI